MAVIFDLVEVVVRTGRVVHQHHVVVAQIVAQEAVVEAERSVGHGVDRFTLGVAARPCEFRRGLAEIEHEHPVDLAAHLGLAASEFRGLGLGFGCVAQFQTPFTEFQREQLVEARGAVRRVGFGHHFGGNHAVFANDVGDAGKLAAVRKRIAEQPVDRFVVHRTVGGVDHSLQKQVGLLKLVEEEVVVLRQLGHGQVVLCHHLGAEHIEAREQPAASRRALVGDPFGGDAVRKLAAYRPTGVEIAGKRIDVVGRDGIADGTVGRSVLVGRLDGGHHLRADTAGGLLRRSAEASEDDCRH